MKTIIKKYHNLPVQIKASLWFVFAAFLQKAISAISTPVFTRIMNTAQYGEYNVFNSWMSIINCFVTLNLYGGFYTQGLVKFDKNKKIFSSSLQGLTLILTIVFLGIYLLFHQLFNVLFSLNTMEMLCMFILIWTAACFNFWAVEQRVSLKYKNLVFITALSSLINPSLGIWMVINSKNKVLARILSTVIVSVCFYPILAIFQLKRGKKFYSKEYWKYALTFSIPLIPHYLSQMILNSSDRIMIQKMVSNSAAGIYSLAYSIAQIMMLFNTSLLQTIEPWIYQKIRDKETHKIKRIAYPSFILIGLLNLFLIMFAPEIIKLFAPSSYYDAIWVIPPISMSVYFMFTYSFFALFEFYFEKPNYITTATIIGAVLNVILNYVFIRIFGYYAAGYTTLLCYMVYSCLHYFFMTKICKKELDGIHVYSLRKLIIISTILLCLSLVIMMSYTNNLVRYFIIVLMFIILFINKNKIISMINMLKNIKNTKDS